MKNKLRCAGFALQLITHGYDRKRAFINKYFDNTQLRRWKKFSRHSSLGTYLNIATLSYLVGHFTNEFNSHKA